MQQYTAAMIVMAAMAGMAPGQAGGPASSGLPAGTANRHYVSNRAPLMASPLTKLPVGAVRPEGWVRGQLVRMADGFSGRLTELSQFCKYDGNAWTSPDGAGKYGWEEAPYWLKGYIDLGYVLGDKRIIDESSKWVEAVLKSQRPDGYFGAKANLAGENTLGPIEALDIWPNMVMMYVLRTHYEATGDKRVIPFMTNYFKWFSKLPLHQILSWSWQKYRAGDQLDSMYWLYNRTGDRWLLDAARVNHERTADWVGSIPTWHGVNISECFREPGQYYQQTGDRRYLDATERVYETVRGIYGRQTGGMFGADENARPGHTGPRQGTETCSFVEMMFSHEMLAGITGEAKWIDRAEEIAFNSLPASMTPDLKGLHYLTAPNQIQLDRGNKSPSIENGGDMFSYNPWQYRCCQHNAAMGWPYYAERMWMATRGDGLAAVFYGASEVKAKVGAGVDVTITETTEYPFGETVQMKVETAKAVKFPLALRIPGWCERPSVKVNGKTVAGVEAGAGWATVERMWANGDIVEILLPMTLKVRRWPEMKNAASVEYGPLTFSLKIGERWRKYGQSEKWPGWEVFPETDWNYALVADAAKMRVVRKEGALSDQPFTHEAAPLSIVAKGRKIAEWKQYPNGMIGEIQASPVRAAAREDEITLIPMGAARLRVSMFPVAGEGNAGAVWDENPGWVTSSSMSHFEQPGVMVDGNAKTAMRFQAAGRRARAHWAEMRFEAAKRVNWCEFVWLENTGASPLAPGRVKVLYRDGAEWEEVRGRQGEAAAGRITFDGVETTGLRIEFEAPAPLGSALAEWRTGQVQ